MKKICPICKIDLDNAIFHNVEVDYCPKCLGIFFEEEELRWAKDERDKDLRWLDVDLWKYMKDFKISYGERLCPSCRVPLYEVRYGNSQIIVDVCNICHGFWLDRAEFEKIIEYLKAEANYKILKDYTRSLMGELWEIFSGPENLRDEILDFLAIAKLMNYKFATRHPLISLIISKLPK